MNGTGGTVKNDIFRKIKSGKLVVYFQVDFSEAVTKKLERKWSQNGDA